MRFDTTREYTIGEMYRPAMDIETEEEAQEYFQALVDYSVQRHGHSLAEAARVERANLGYFAGYYDHDTRLRVERLFSCQHPMFGAAKNGAPTAEEAFETGVAMASASEPPS